MTLYKTHPVQSPTIPDALIKHEQWICWRIKDRNENTTKVPIVPGTGEYASATDPETWRSFNEALEYCECGGAAGIGFVFTEEDPFVGVDLDGCRDPETRLLSTGAREIILKLDSFTEISPSGTGYHIIVRGSISGDRRRRGSVEIYETARFFTVTGDHIDMTPARVRDRPGALETVYNEFIDETESRGRTEAGRQYSAAESRGVALADEELLERARNARNGEKFDRLWRGSTISYSYWEEPAIIGNPTPAASTQTTRTAQASPRTSVPDWPVFISSHALSLYSNLPDDADTSAGDPSSYSGNTGWSGHRFRRTAGGLS